MCAASPTTPCPAGRAPAPTDSGLRDTLYRRHHLRELAARVTTRLHVGSASGLVCATSDCTYAPGRGDTRTRLDTLNGAFDAARQQSASSETGREGP